MPGPVSLRVAGTKAGRMEVDHMSEPEGRGAAWNDAPKGRGAAWTEERGARNERRATREGGAVKGEGEAGGAPEAHRQQRPRPRRRRPAAVLALSVAAVLAAAGSARAGRAPCT